MKHLILSITLNKDGSSTINVACGSTERPLVITLVTHPTACPECLKTIMAGP